MNKNIESHEYFVKSLIIKKMVKILDIIGKYDKNLYVGGGVIRNLIWDSLHNYTNETPLNDIDIIYFDTIRNKKTDDLIIQEYLIKKQPRFSWSVKNQARMHSHKNNLEKPYLSLHDAIAKWPETASSIAGRLDDKGKIDLIAPYGYDDLFNLIVTPTPYFTGRENIIKNRIIKKKWLKIWPKLTLKEIYV